jgi:hypothetical protein
LTVLERASSYFCTWRGQRRKPAVAAPNRIANHRFCNFFDLHSLPSCARRRYRLFAGDEVSMLHCSEMSDELTFRNQVGEQTEGVQAQKSASSIYEYTPF